MKSNHENLGLFGQMLVEKEGMIDVCAARLEDGMDKLHSALTKCDKKHLEIFFRNTLIHRINQFSTIEDLADIKFPCQATTMYNHSFLGTGFYLSGVFKGEGKWNI
ncbi:MAG: hypothetical protein ACUZ8H_14000 [Candidatus Anammoxibacter sp.]